MGSDSLAESGGGSNESIHGLKFGKKIYFEDAAASGASNKATGPGSSSSGSGRKVRGGGSSSGGSSGSGGVAQTGQPPRCQVEGCQVDLSDAKTYYSRHKVCGMHSKSPMVIVAGLQQRFCQQCSRFHQLPEFDQGKRSCRRRLAGHNERRRKPPPGSLLTTRFGRPTSSLSDSSSRGGGFLVDFSAYSRGGRDAWPLSRSTEQVPTNQTTAAARHHVGHHPPWHNRPENPPASEIFLQGSGSGTHFPSGECFTGVADSSCALSLLSNQSWGSSSRNQPSALGVAHTQGVSMTQSHPTAAAVNQYPNVPWGSFSGEMPPHLGLGSVSNPIVDGQFGGGLDLSQHSRGPHNHMELDHARDDYGASAEQMHWSL